ncbi:MAG: invasin domain 3-containing protein, partial [Promethearchaeota archaeon]
QAAKIIGADTRCAVRGTSSQSGFVKVVRIGDGNSPYLQIVVPDTPVGTDPIDVLQGMFDDWKDSLFAVVDPFLSEISVDPDSLPADGISKATITISPKNNSDTLLISGLQILLTNTGAGLLSPVTDLGNGIYEATINASVAIGTDTISAMVISGSDTVSIFWKAIVRYLNPTSADDNSLSPNKFHLYQNYPQPFNPTTTIKYQIPIISYVSLKVFDVLGNEMESLVDQEKSAGTFEVDFDGAGLTSGVYFYTLKAIPVNGMTPFKESKKMILIK